ncbi:hypothetical protein AGOR_G00130800 [Albula goreensis]|uniref:Uncharacterized protein n=1 Tax=Albula goreensis TaxID=1534307 RepID=A0A8T3D3K4_9TELE|nr:hypothetical protein AGOR_G00130800 [Albula goreensis]
MGEMADRKSGTVMESLILLAPVTALEFLEEDYLLAGEGPVLSVYSLQTPPTTCASLSTLRNQRIHGIRLDPWRKGRGRVQLSFRRRGQRNHHGNKKEENLQM